MIITTSSSSLQSFFLPRAEAFLVALPGFLPRVDPFSFSSGATSFLADAFGFAGFALLEVGATSDFG